MSKESEWTTEWGKMRAESDRLLDEAMDWSGEKIKDYEKYKESENLAFKSWTLIPKAKVKTK